eukprot:5543996-Karenia_brevis.AAC.1
MHEACARIWARITDACYGVALAELEQRAKAAEAELLDEPRHRKSWSDFEIQALGNAMIRFDAMWKTCSTDLKNNGCIGDNARAR